MHFEMYTKTQETKKIKAYEQKKWLMKRRKV